MPNECNKILKYNHGENSLKAPTIIYVDLQGLLEKNALMSKYPEKSYTDKKLSIPILAIHCLQIVHLIRQKIGLIGTKVKTVWKVFVRT